MDARAARLLVVLLLLTGAAGGVLWAEARLEPRRRQHTDDFQRLVGGVGFGPAVALTGCAFGFDPRLDGRCEADRGPIPGGACFCPRHAGSVFHFPPLARPGPEGQDDGPVP
jgi:hypothetical protein